MGYCTGATRWQKPHTRACIARVCRGRIGRYAYCKVRTSAQRAWRRRRGAAVDMAGAMLGHVARSGKFDGEFAKGAQTYAGTGTLRYTW
jgi:hypothetical protein